MNTHCVFCEVWAKFLGSFRILAKRYFCLPTMKRISLLPWLLPIAYSSTHVTIFSTPPSSVSEAIKFYSSVSMILSVERILMIFWYWRITRENAELVYFASRSDTCNYLLTRRRKRFSAHISPLFIEKFAEEKKNTYFISNKHSL